MRSHHKEPTPLEEHGRTVVHETERVSAAQRSAGGSPRQRALCQRKQHYS